MAMLRRRDKKEKKSRARNGQHGRTEEPVGRKRAEFDEEVDWNR
jgi:hypothetical protein